MRVLQLIDSLEVGGAERVAVNYANGLLNHIDGSYLCTTRAEGLLKHSLKKEVGYLYLKRTKTVDFKAIRTLSKFINTNGITIIHAHASSYFLATLIKVLNPKLKLIWHDHYGKSDFLDERPKGVLKFCSRFFNHIFCVNSKLKTWAENELNASSVSFLFNFAVSEDVVQTTVLKGKKGKRMVCLANLRPQKDHLNLLKAFKRVTRVYPDWSLHLIGKDFKDDYAQRIFQCIEKENLEHQVYSYGSCTDISAILKQSDIGVLASKSEGLPLALLEYGLASLPVVSTDVGDCKKIIENENLGYLILSENVDVLHEALLCLMKKSNEEKRSMGDALNKHIELHFSQKKTITKVLTLYRSIERNK